MSLSNSLFEKIIKNKCNHNNIINKNKSFQKSYFYCYKCNNIILIDNNKFYSTFKLITHEENISDKSECDPVSIVRRMIQRQNEQIKEINEKLVLNFNFNDEITTNVLSNTEKNNHSGLSSPRQSEKKEKEKESIKNLKSVNSELISINTSVTQALSHKKSNGNKLPKLLFDEETFERYARQRNKVLVYIHKLCTKLKYNDSSFYLSLYLLDTYLSRIFFDDISERELLLVVIGFFLISSKYIEDDIFEPELQIFCNIEKSISLTMEEIRSSEVQCLTLINYNLYLYSAYDWLITLLNNGIVFENEIKDKNILENIYIDTQQLLTILTSKLLFCKFSSLQIALSIVQLSREKFLNNNSEISKRLFKLLISLYGINFSDYEECYNALKKDLTENKDSGDEEDIDNSNSNSNKTNANTNSNSKTNINKKSIEMKSNKSNDNANEDKEISNLISNSCRQNKFKVHLNSNKSKKKYVNTEFNLKNINKNNNKHKFKLYASPGQTSFSTKKRRFKSNDKYYELFSNNSIGIFSSDSKKISHNILTHNNSSHNSSFKSTNFVPKEKQLLKIKRIKNNENKLVLSGKNQKKKNIFFINYAPKFLIKNAKTKINKINYINNININNEIINLYSASKKKKMHKNRSSGLNFNLHQKKSENKKSNSKEKKLNLINKSIFTMDNSNRPQVNYDYNINNMNFNKKLKKSNNNNIHIITNQNFIEINNDIISEFKKNKHNHNKIGTSKKEKYRTHLLLDVSNNPAGLIYNRNDSNQYIIQTEKENKSCNKYSFNGYNIVGNYNHHDSKKKFKMFLGRKNEIKIMNTNININLNNKFGNRKFTINFKDIINKKLKMKRTNNFQSKDKKANIKRFNSLNSNNYIIKNNNKNKESKNHGNNNGNGHKSKKEKANIFIDTKSENLNKKMIGIENNLLNYKNLAKVNSRLPRLKLNKNIFMSNK
jgi:hypothetical protein